MKFLPLFCLATFTFLPLAGADLTVVQSIESKDKDNKTVTNKVTIKIKGDRARIRRTPSMHDRRHQNWRSHRPGP